MTCEPFRDFIVHASGGAEIIFRKRGAILPMWHAVTRTGEELIFPAEVFARNKDAECAMARALFELRDVTRYVFIDEAWMVAAWKADATPQEHAALERKAQEAMRIGASNHPDRVEIVGFWGDDETEGTVLARRCIIRPARGRPSLAPLEFDPRGGAFAGRFVGLLPRPKGPLQ